MKAETQHLREWLLEADMNDLRQPPAEVAKHLAECVTCRSALRTLLHGYRDLDAGLDAVVRPKSRRWLWLPAPLVAAALAALLLMRSEPLPQGPAPILAQLMFPEEPIVTPSAGEEAIVMEKDEVTIVWLTKTRGQQ